MCETIYSFFSHFTIETVISLVSIFVSLHAWYKANKKITLLDPTQSNIPNWFMQRMGCGDEWPFGLITLDGNILAIKKINKISDDCNWIDAELLNKEEYTLDPNSFLPLKLIFSPTNRNNTSIQVSKIIAAIEIATS